jgi:hypothetical protein
LPEVAHRHRGSSPCCPEREGGVGDGGPVTEEIDDEGVASISLFFADMVGKLEALNFKVVARLEHEGKEIAG